MNHSNTLTILAHTFKESIRAKWLMMFAVVFFLLAVNIPMLILLAVRYLPPNYLDVYLNYLVTLSFPFLPLLALPMGASSIIEERESGVLQYILSNPISRGEFLVGRLLGLLLSTTVVVVLGYGTAALMTFNVNVERYGAVGEVTLVGATLNAIMVGIAVLVSILAKRKATALGVGIFLWFLFTVLSDLGFLSFILNLRSGPTSVLPIILLNPIETARILAVIILGGGNDQLGVPGVIVTYLLGDLTSLVLIGALLSWMIVFFSLCYLTFRKQDI